ncbi:ORF6N domain-containing protein [Mucilaginibacter sp. ZT4R22]|uniref:ORF6N domain-containing protein n=1 Tax=Mucilaginibacter pankratovii TaxID=2772110 RepID=A0ABR7WUM8_9SPHI|nr:ORF6N domain-containing protein [Mucilaginibacter pankratovii]MBD1365242.1 ORF6N domain-containing protein [Mucilaginibacter pankratovii]
MANEIHQYTIPDEIILNQIYYLRGHKIMLDTDLAELYEVETKQLKRQVRRNIERFPEDFMFELTDIEYGSLRSQIGTLKRGEHSKYLPMAFTEQGVAMLSSVLNSRRAISVNIQIIRIFTKLRQMFIDNTDLRLEIEKIKTKLDNHDKNMEIVFQYLDELVQKKEEPKIRKRIGYKSDDI